MKIIIKNKEARKYANELLCDPRVSRKTLIKLVNIKFGEGTAIRRRLTSEEWVEHYEFWLAKNAEAGAPKLIIEELKKKLEYWKRRR